MMMVDFADHFWGDKHNGFTVLYQNMKNGQVSMKELTEFLKETTLVEDDYQKHLTKIIKQVSNYGAVGLMEKVSQIQVQLLQKLHDVAKEIQKYGDEQQKSHKSLRENESKTMDAVNLMQTTTTCLQKAKENYAARCLEHEKLKRENAPPKELTKSDNRIKKAADEYRQYVDKYAKIRDNYEQRMISSSRNFQEFESNHLNQMKQLVINYAQSFEESSYQVHQVSLEFRDQLTNLNVEEILRDFAEKKGTGEERPTVYTFEEADLNAVSSSTAVDITSRSIMEDGASPPDGSSTLLAEVLGSVGAVTTASDTLELTTDGTLPLSSNATMNGPTNGAQQTTNRKLALWLPGRKKPTSNSKLPTPTPSPSDGVVPQSNSSTDIGGFLRGKKSKDSSKKKKDSDNRSELSNEDAKSQSSGGGKTTNALSELIDEEGYTIRPAEDAAKTSSRKANESSSEDDTDEDTPKKLTFQIKQQSEKSISASVDQLKDAFKDVNIYSYPGFATRPRLSKEMSLDDFDPMKSSSSNLGGGDPWNPSAKPELLRPAKTGDDRYNTKLFAGLQWPSVTTTTTGRKKSSGEPWPDEGGDTVGNLTSVSWNNTTARSRPRSTTPTQAFDAQIGRSFSANSSWDQMSMMRNDSMEFSSSPLTNAAFASGGTVTSPGRPDSTPLAVALTETAHVLFKSGSSSSGCTIKIYGSLTISFPAAFIQTLSSISSDDDLRIPPLAIKLTNADKIQSLVPNRQVLPNESTFKADSTHELSFNMRSLSTYLKQRSESASTSPFFNLDVLRYEVRCEPNAGSAPLMLQSFWKCQPSQTDIVVQYNYNSSCPLSAPLLNLQFSTQVDGEVTQAQLKPEGSWNSENSRLVWKLTELSRHGESSGSLKARLNLIGGPSTPVATTVNFQMNDVCLSGADVQLIGSGYRISLLKKRLIAGRYLCEPETR